MKPSRKTRSAGYKFALMVNEVLHGTLFLTVLYATEGLILFRVNSKNLPVLSKSQQC